MKLIIIHGPPAVGKLTVAQELSRITGYKIFHNHLINDLVESVFEYGSTPYGKLVGTFWIAMLSTAAAADIDGVIMTYCYAKKSDDIFIRTIVKAVEKNNGTVRSVLLTCDVETLYKRVSEKSRKAYGKLKKSKKLKKVLADYELFSPISFVEGFKIDNTKLSAKKTAEKIRRKFHL